MFSAATANYFIRSVEAMITRQSLRIPYRPDDILSMYYESEREAALYNKDAAPHSASFYHYR